MLHHLLHNALWTVGYFLGGIVTLSLVKLFTGNEFENDHKLQGVFFAFWPALMGAIAIVGAAAAIYSILTKFKYINPLYLSDKLSNKLKPTFNVWKYKWSQRGLGVKNDWSSDG